MRYSLFNFPKKLYSNMDSNNFFAEVAHRVAQQGIKVPDFLQGKGNLHND